MRFLKKKRYAIPAVVAATVLAVAGSAFAYFTAAGSGTGSASVGTASGLVINQTGVTAYNSRMSNPLDYNWSQCFYCVGMSEFGNRVDLSGSGLISSAVVDMANFGTVDGPMSMTFSVYDAGSGSSPGQLLASDTESVSVPATATGYDPTLPAPWGIDNFTATFDNFKYTSYFENTYYPASLPSTVVYGITYNDAQNIVNGGVNVQLSYESQVSAGSDTDAGHLFVTVNPAWGSDVAPGEVTCSTGSTTFTEYSTASGSNCGYGTPALVPAVQINLTGTASGLWPGSPAQPINFTVYNPGTTGVTVNTVTVGVAENTATGDVESVSGDTSTDVSGCYASWFTVNGSPLTLNEAVGPGQTITVNDAVSLSMINEPYSQDVCQGANVGLTFSSN